MEGFNEGRSLENVVGESIILSFYKSLLRAFYVPGTMLLVGSTMMRKITPKSSK